MTQSRCQTDPRGWAGELLQTTLLGLPIGFTQLLQASLGFTDTIMLGRLDIASLGACALGSVIFYATFLLGFGPAMAVTPIVSQTLGQGGGDLRAPVACLRAALLVTLALYPAALGVHLLAPGVAAWFGQPAAVVARLGNFMLALSPGLPFMVGSLALRNFLAALGFARIGLIIISMTVLLNAALNYLLIYGHAGLPQMGLVGSGVSTSIAYMSGFLALAIYSSHVIRGGWRSLLRPMLELPMIAQVCRFGFTIGAAMAFEVTVFNASIFVVGRVGPSETAAYQIALSLIRVGFMIPLGFGIAGCIRVGLAHGRADLPAARRAVAATITLSLLVIGIITLPVYLSPNTIIRLYLGATPAVGAANAALAFLPFTATFMCLDVLQMAVNQCLRGFTDVYVPTLLLGVSSWLIGLPIALYFGQPTRLGALGVMVGLTAGLASAVIMLGSRLYFRLRSIQPARRAGRHDGAWTPASSGQNQ